MVDEFGRTGQAAGAGFYDYGDAGEAGCGRGCASTSPARRRAVPFADMQERMLFAEALDTVRCLEEGVLTAVADANIGSIMGIGFPAWTAACCSTSTGTRAAWPASWPAPTSWPTRYGERFRPPAILLERAVPAGSLARAGGEPR